MGGTWVQDGDQVWEQPKKSCIRDNVSALSRGNRTVFFYHRESESPAAALLQGSRGGMGQRMNRWEHMAFGTSPSAGYTERSLPIGMIGLTEAQFTGENGELGPRMTWR